MPARAVVRAARRSVMNWEMFLSWQFGMTLAAAAAIGFYQLRSIRRSREKRGEHGHVSHPPMQSGPPGDDTPSR
jgi:hypothetical protein